MKKIVSILLVVLGIVVIGGVIGAFAGWQWAFSPVSLTDSTIQTVIITPGQTTAAVAQALTDKGLIRHPLVFRFVVAQENLEGRLQAGTFKLQKGKECGGSGTGLIKAARVVNFFHAFRFAAICLKIRSPIPAVHASSVPGLPTISGPDLTSLE